MRKKIRRSAAALAVCAALLLSSPVAAAGRQSASATLRGVVTDAQGAVVAGATVRATNVANGAARETKTNGEGAYALTNLQPGEPGLYWPRYRLPCMSSARSGGRFLPVITDLK